MAVLFRCDQCAHEEWREADQEPWLCPVCGWMRWEAVADDGADGAASADGDPGDPVSGMG